MPPPVSLHSFRDLGVNQQGMNRSSDIVPNSPLELALINIVLPHTPHLLIPLHPQRFLALLSLPAHDPQRPHPALLYVLFTEAVRILERDIPPPSYPARPSSLFPQSFAPPLPSPTMDRSSLLPLVQGTSLNLLERARTELEHGIRNVDRPFDLVRASIGIARHLYSLGRFIEGWSIPVSRLTISCGLHRQTGNIVPPGGSNTADILPLPYAPSHFYMHNNLLSTPIGPFPVLRMRPMIIPPPRDEIEAAERNLTFWSAKMQDWEAGVGWGWTTAMADEECTTEWPWSWGSPAVGAVQAKVSVRAD